MSRSRGGFGSTLLLMIIKRTICAKPLGCFLLSSHMELIFHLLLLWVSLHVWIEARAIKMHTKYCFMFLCMHCVLTLKRAALIKGMQWCTIWVTKHPSAQHQARLSYCTRGSVRSLLPTVTSQVHKERQEHSQCKHNFEHWTRANAGVGLWGC